MLHRFSRTELLTGHEGFKKLEDSCVAIFGLGGVGSYAAEAFARAGVGKLVLVDFDLICATNTNRQLHAMIGTIGKAKTEVMAERFKKINPKVEVVAHQTFYNAERADDLLSAEYDYVVDAIDNVTAKLNLIGECHERGIPVISAMGAASKMDPTQLKVADISKTHTCPFARDIRKELGRKYGIKRGVKVVFSTEPAITPDQEVASCEIKCICPATKPSGVNDCEAKKQINGTMSYLPPMFGMMMAGVAIQDLLATTPRKWGGQVPEDMELRTVEELVGHVCGH
jgi:tRNA A37 threonylcarbamoyladenosine dehydratase